MRTLYERVRRILVKNTPHAYALSWFVVQSKHGGFTRLSSKVSKGEIDVTGKTLQDVLCCVGEYWIADPLPRRERLLFRTILEIAEADGVSKPNDPWLEAQRALSAHLQGRAMEQLTTSSVLGQDALHGLDDLRAYRIPRLLSCGIYFLFAGEELVYVGQSENVFSRVNQHSDKHFDSVTVIPCSKRSLDDLEAAYILKFRPRLNKASPALRHRDVFNAEAVNP